MGNGFENMVETAVMNARIRGINKNKIAFTKFSCNFVSVSNLSFSTLLSKLPGEYGVRIFSALYDIPIPRIAEKQLGGARGLKWLRRVTWCGGTLTRSLNERSKCCGFGRFPIR